MCGIFGGVVTRPPALGGSRGIERHVERLFLLSESRGKEAAGLAVSHGDTLAVHKAAVPASRMVQTRPYRQFIRSASGAGPLAFIGHSRLVTDGAREKNKNNQPVTASGIVGIHNGIIVNHAFLWREHSELERHYDIDSEVIFALLAANLRAEHNLQDATRRTFSELEGVASVAALFDDRDALLLATNNGSLYYRMAPGAAAFVFASEGNTLTRLARGGGAFADGETVHLRSGQAAIVDLKTASMREFPLRGPAPLPNGVGAKRPSREIIDSSPAASSKPRPPRPESDVAALERKYPYVSLRDRLKRCSRCVLPETMPYIDFDDDGVCAYCRHYRPLEPHGRDELERAIAPHRRSDGTPDCVVGVSGGRDSTYGLYYIKKELGLTPVAYTYDWGMVTDLARRNVSRICGQLGVEHILVSADIQSKRENIRKNVDAWLHRPSLATVPLFMAGDKEYFFHYNRLKKQFDVEMSFLCENPLERTDFKTGFAGIPPFNQDEDHSYTLPVLGKLRMLGLFGSEFLRNPKYINRSLIDSARAFAFYYLISHDHLNLYRYIQWDEQEVESTILGPCNFELAKDTKTTWRIGDGTAAFYNYIYHSIAGLTENDTFRSNQIRMGVLDRNTALDLVERDNRPRLPSIQWYLNTIDLDKSLEEVIDIIEAVPKRWR